MLVLRHDTVIVTATVCDCHSHQLHSQRRSWRITKPAMLDGIVFGSVGRTYEQIKALPVADLACKDTPAFVFLWCGCAEGLDAGRCA